MVFLVVDAAPLGAGLAVVGLGSVFGYYAVHLGSFIGGLTERTLRQICPFSYSLWQFTLIIFSGAVMAPNGSAPGPRREYQGHCGMPLAASWRVPVGFGEHTGTQIPGNGAGEAKALLERVD